MASPLDFLDRGLLPFVRATVDLTADRHDFSPAGGGTVIAHLNLPKSLARVRRAEAWQRNVLIRPCTTDQADRPYW